ncbi:TonB-dependent receptor [Bacteroides pyogenes JCM 10003]|uniref:TonB-dependent receptor n=2 Tax=Bacteroides pyogenes TaxID=310300 RepID=W4PJ82_9BACE|nr:TonB-dependent receptor [Bacteroides pyogenes JCM 6292]GAE19204.1 TonB-dependent receptor [Bacteroides pyogenes DSM 20611 = JCM 6294]GAE22909.1 TonB-dependent receptor [Bacteroides pyogenes JCM 10003]
MDGKLNPKATLGYSDGTYYYTPDDWYNELFDKGNLRQDIMSLFLGLLKK